jgi:hypothetical protein
MVIAVTAIITAGVTAIVLAALISKSIQSRRKLDARTQGDSLTKTELRQLLSEAVAEATDPLYAKVGAIERRLDHVSSQLAAPERTQPLQLEPPDQERGDALPH